MRSMGQACMAAKNGFNWQEHTYVYCPRCCALEGTGVYGPTLVLQATVMDAVGAVVGQRGECMSALERAASKAACACTFTLVLWWGRGVNV